MSFLLCQQKIFSEHATISDFSPLAPSPNHYLIFHRVETPKKYRKTNLDVQRDT